MRCYIRCLIYQQIRNILQHVFRSHLRGPKNCCFRPLDRDSFALYFCLCFSIGLDQQFLNDFNMQRFEKHFCVFFCIFSTPEMLMDSYCDRSASVIVVGVVVRPSSHNFSTRYLLILPLNGFFKLCRNDLGLVSLRVV